MPILRRQPAHRARHLGQHAVGRPVAVGGAIALQAVDRQGDDRHRLVALVADRGGEIGLRDLADEQAGRLVDPQAGAAIAPARQKAQQFALARLPAVELGLEPQCRAHARDQLDAVDRLGDVVGGAGHEGVGQACSMSSRDVTMMMGRSE